jgi:hypothetical protein
MVWCLVNNRDKFTFNGGDNDEIISTIKAAANNKTT